MLNKPLKYTDFSGENYDGEGLTSGQQTGLGAAAASLFSSINWKGLRWNDVDEWTTKNIFRPLQSVGDWIGGWFKKRSSGDKPIGTNYCNFFNNSLQQGTVFTTNAIGIAITNSATFGIVQPNRAFEGTDFELAERLGRFTGDMLSFGGGVSLDVGAAGLELVTVGGGTVPAVAVASYGTSLAGGSAYAGAKEFGGIVDYFGKNSYKGTGFRGGSKKSRDGYLNSKPFEFRKWFERFYKDKKFPNSSNSHIDEAFDEWERMGRPFPK